ncbi:MAG: 50S ribosomal protein L4 [Rickettsiales bacterium]|jgi:large subunit ribosomal protein L4|nr:50S ribosomal protein L4 [Rickettsiales bacterium]
MKIDVINLDGKAAGNIELSDAVFGIAPRSDILQRVVHWQLANARQGTHLVKTVSDVSGSGHKVYKQKKTGNARQGEKRNVHMRGGGVIHGPVLRDHHMDLPKKIRALGLRMAVSSHALAKTLIVLDSEKVAEAKTGAVAKQLAKLKLKSALFVGGAALDANFKKSIANIANVDALPAIGANVRDILKHKTLVLTKEGAEALEKRLGD